MSNAQCQVKIGGMGVVTPYGSGVERLWAGLQSAESKIQWQKYGLNGHEQWFPVGLCEEQTSLVQMMEESIREVFQNYPQRIPSQEIELVLATALGGIKDAETYLLGKLHLGADYPPQLLKRYSFQKIYQDLRDKFALGGSGVIISTTCTSSQNALLYGYERIRQGAKKVLVVGGDQVSQTILQGMNSVRALTQNGVKPFDRTRDGLAIGEGAGAILLEPSSGAKDKGLALLEKIYSCNESFSLSAPRKDAQGLFNCLEAMDQWGSITILAAANGTQHNDAAILTALKRFYGQHQERLKITAVKGGLGHTLGGSGVIETIVGVLMLQNRKLVPICGLEDPEESIIHFVTEKEPFCGGRLLYLSAGFGGNCSALLLS